MREDLKQKVEKSIQRLQTFCPPEGYYLAFSGGKDSCVCKALLDMSGCKYDAHYRVTGIDPPELVKFIKEFHPDVQREVPRDKDGKPITMWKLIEKKLMPPTRAVRYCCQELKESGGDGRMCVTGVRWAESINRKNNQGAVLIRDKKHSKDMIKSGHFVENKKDGVILVNDNEDSRRMIERCYKANKTTVNPIIEWTDADVWDFIKEHEIQYCKLYDEGWKRIGCLCCPLASKKKRERDLRLYPKYKNAYMMAFKKMLIKRKQLERDTKWTNVQDVMHWWMNDDVLPGQINLFDYGEETE